MSYIYSSNTPYFLEYIAACKTRNEIYNDPNLCILLEDPHIKDNMELALKARAADYGDYDKKVEFVGFFLANGPELDTDTIMHYRKKILMSYTYSRIAREEFGDIETVDKLRTETYNKKVEDRKKDDDSSSDNCFTNPCDYLQPLSATLGMIGDSENFKTPFNLFARKSRENKEEKDNKDNKNNKDDKKTDNKNTEDKPTDSIWGSIRKHTISRVIPAFEDGYRTMMKALSNQVISLTEKNRKANLEKEVTSVGDSRAEEVSEAASGAVKLNIFANMGDCARMWEQLRRYRVYDASQNAKGPIDESSVNTTRTVEGLPKNMPGARTEDSLAQGATTTNAPGADPNAGKRAMHQRVLEYMRKEAMRKKEEALKNNKNWDYARVSGSDETEDDSVYYYWAECAKLYGWKTQVWQAAYNAYVGGYSLSGMSVVGDGDRYLKNPFLDSGSDYWNPGDNKVEYDKKKAEFTTLFGIPYPYDDPSTPEDESNPSSAAAPATSPEVPTTETPGGETPTPETPTPETPETPETPQDPIPLPFS